MRTGVPKIRANTCEITISRPPFTRGTGEPVDFRVGKSTSHGQKHASKYKTQAMEAKTFREIDELLKEWVAQVSFDYEDQ